MSYLDLLKLAAPETIVVLTALLVLAVDLTSMRGLELRLRFIVGGLLTLVGCAVAIAWMLVIPVPPNALEGMLVVDPLTQLVKVALLALTVFTVLISIESDFTHHVGEYLALILMATAGMMFLVSAGDLLMLFVALEMTSLSLYILTAFNKRNIQSAEAALKYFLVGGLSAAFLLFGLSWIYGVAGTTDFHKLAAALAAPGLDPLLIVALVLAVIGFGFKVAAVPFHLWAPDAYQGAPTPSAAFIASGSKVASFFIFAKLMMLGFAGTPLAGSAALPAGAAGWVPVVAVVAAFSMLLGNLVAIVQSNVKRLLAYSAIAHAGYMLLAVLAHDPEAVASLVYYAATYGLTTIGAFGVVAVVEQGAGDSRLSDFAGLCRRAPVVAWCMMVFMLSLAGIPPLVGFFGKFYLFTVALKTGAQNLGLLWLVILAVGMSVVSLYYYLQVLKQIYVADVPADAGEWRVSVFSQIVLGLLAAGVILLGAIPGWLLSLLRQTLSAG